jgi:transposase InsO family protein
MAARDVTDTMEMALAASGCRPVWVRHGPRLLSDNGPSYIAGDLADWLADMSSGKSAARLARYIGLGLTTPASPALSVPLAAT